MPEVERTIVRKPANGPFIVATKSELGVRRALAWKSALAIPAGIAASAAGVWLAIEEGFLEQGAAGMLVAGASLGVAFNALGDKVRKTIKRIG